MWGVNICFTSYLYHQFYQIFKLNNNILCIKFSQTFIVYMNGFGILFSMNIYLFFTIIGGLSHSARKSLLPTLSLSKKMF